MEQENKYASDDAASEESAVEDSVGDSEPNETYSLRVYFVNEVRVDVSDNGTSEEPSAATGNEYLVFITESGVGSNHEDEDNVDLSDKTATDESSDDEDSDDEKYEAGMDLSDDAESEEPSAAEDKMDLRDKTATEESSDDEDGDGEELVLSPIHCVNSSSEDDYNSDNGDFTDEDDDLINIDDLIGEDVRNANMGRMDTKAIDLKFARDACKLDIDDVVSNEDSLKCLDLATTQDVGYKKWCQKVESEYIRIKCPELTQDKIKTLREMVELGTIFPLPEFYDELLDEKKREVLEHYSEFFDSYSIPFLESLESLNRKSKRRSILRFMTLVKILKVLTNRSDFPRYLHLHLELMEHLRTDFKDDSKLVIYVLHNLCVRLNERFSLFTYGETEDLEFLMGHALKQRYNFWFLYDNSNWPDFPFNVLTKCLSKQECRNTETLLKYGFPYVFARSSFSALCTEIFRDAYWIDEATGEYDLGFLMDESEMKTLLQLSPANLRSQMVLQLFLPFLRGPTDHFETVLTKWSRSIPDPYVTPSEMFERLKDYVEPWFFNGLLSICDSYAKTSIFDDDHTVATPRALSHLCRCTVRKTLKRRYELPNGIEKLGLPSKIQDYLLLES